MKAKAVDNPTTPPPQHCVHIGWHTSGMTFCIHASTARMGVGGGGGAKEGLVPPIHPLVNCENKNFILTPWGGCKIGEGVVGGGDLGLLRGNN